MQSFQHMSMSLHCHCNIIVTRLIAWRGSDKKEMWFKCLDRSVYYLRSIYYRSGSTVISRISRISLSPRQLDGNERFCSRGARYPAAITSVTAPSKTRILSGAKSTQITGKRQLVHGAHPQIALIQSLQRSANLLVLFCAIFRFCVLQLYSPCAKKLQNIWRELRAPSAARVPSRRSWSATDSVVAQQNWLQAAASPVIRREKLPNPAPWTLRSPKE